MTETKTAGPRGAQKIILAALVGAVVVMFLGSFVYRMKGQGLVVPVQPEQTNGMGGMGAMGGIDVGRMQELMAQMKTRPNDPAVLLELANTFMMMQAWDRALTLVDKAVKVAPDSVEANRAMGMVRFQRKEYPQAEKSFEIVLKLAPDDVLGHYNMGILLKYYLRKPAEGDQHFRRVVQLNPQDADVLKSAQEELAGGGNAAK